MAPSGQVYGGFVFDQDEVIEWGRRLGAVLGNDMPELTRKTPRLLRINSFMSAQATILEKLRPHGSDLEPVGRDACDPYVLLLTTIHEPVYLVPTTELKATGWSLRRKGNTAGVCICEIPKPCQLSARAFEKRKLGYCYNSRVCQ